MKMTPSLRFKFSGNDGNVVEGWGARYGEVDLVGDVIQRGAFAKTVSDFRSSGRRLPMLLAHQQEETIGSWGELRDEPEGLYAVGEINTEVARAREVLSLVKRGDLSGLSIGFRVPEGGLTLASDHWLIHEIQVLEISLCAVPAASRARVVLKDLSGLEDYAEFLRSAGVSRREAEFVARKSWPAITAADTPEIDLDQLAARIEATIGAVKSHRF